MAMEKLFQKIRNLDAYPKINEDFYKRTFSGGLITLFSSFFTLLLMFSEFRSYLRSSTTSKLLVDNTRGGTLHINFDVTFPHVPCSLLSVDAEDVSGEKHHDIKHNIFKKRIDTEGKEIGVRREAIGTSKIDNPLQKHGERLELNETYCGSCYGAEETEHDCCNSCEEVRKAYRRKDWALDDINSIDQCKREGFFNRLKDEDGEGCNIYGSLEVIKVAGSFHITAGKSFKQAHLFFGDVIFVEDDNYNISHKINKLSFGEDYPGRINPLDGVQWVQGSKSGMYQYFLKVVPTLYTNVTGLTLQSNQFSVTEHFRTSEIGHRGSGVFFYYSFSSIKVTFNEQHASFLHFLRNVCAIVGGIFAVSGIIDTLIYHGQKVVKKKLRLGKLN